MRNFILCFCLLLASQVIPSTLYAQTDSLSTDSLRKIQIAPAVAPDGLVADSLANDTLLDKRIIVTVPKVLVPVKDSAAEIKTWRHSISTGINVNQASFSENWKGGGISSIALGLFFNGRIVHETPRTSFTNEAQLLYGIQKNKDIRARKSADRIFLDSKYGYKFSHQWNLFFSVNYLSQFDIGYIYTADSSGNEIRTIISRFMAPGYLTSSFGFEYKPTDYFYIRFGTGTLRQTFVLDTALYHNQETNYGVPVGKKVRNEVAFQFIANLDKEIAKNLMLKSRFMAFANYEDLQAIDTRFDLTFTAKVTKFIDVNLTGSVLYDQDMDYKIQYTQALSLGILYSYSQFPK